MRLLPAESRFPLSALRAPLSPRRCHVCPRTCSANESAEMHRSCQPCGGAAAAAVPLLQSARVGAGCRVNQAAEVLGKFRRRRVFREGSDGRGAELASGGADCVSSLWRSDQQASSWLADEERGRLREESAGGRCEQLNLNFFEDKKMEKLQRSPWRNWLGSAWQRL